MNGYSRKYERRYTKGYDSDYVGSAPGVSYPLRPIANTLVRVKIIQEVLEDLLHLSRVNVERLDTLSRCIELIGSSKVAQESVTDSKEKGLCVNKEKSKSELDKVYDEGSRNDDKDSKSGITSNDSLLFTPASKIKEQSSESTGNKTDQKHRRRNV